MRSPALKAGLIGALVLILIALLGLIPALSCVSSILSLLALPLIGVLAAYFMAPRREPGPAAGQGALAGLIAGAINGVAAVILTPLQVALSGGPQGIVDQFPPEMLQQLEQAGVDPGALFSTGTFAGVALLCCLPAVLVLGAGLGALGGLIYAAVQPE